MVETEQVPLYSKLSFDLIEYITTHGQVHQKMLSEREICKEYGVSRTTVRTALKELETLGYIYKRHGKGTFISSQWKERQNLLEGYSFTEQMKDLGRTPSTIITAFHYYKADSYIAQQLGIETGEYIYRLKRIRFADGVPMMKETTFLPARAEASNSNLTSTVPFDSVGVNLVDPVTAGSSSFPVSLSIKRPETSYSLPSLLSTVAGANSWSVPFNR